MITGGALMCAAVALCFLVTSSLWAERRYARFARLPAQFGVTGRPNWFAPRSFVLWLTPAIFIGVTSLLLLAVASGSAKDINGEPSQVLILTSFLVVGIQALILFLIGRWAASAD